MDVWHSKTQPSIGGIVASFNQSLTRYYSETAVHAQGKNLCPYIVNVHNYGPKQTIKKGSEYYALCINAHTCKIWISPVSDGTYLDILDTMKSPEKGDSSGHMPT